MSWSYIIALSVDAIGILIALYFLISDSLRASSSNNGPLGLVTLAFCCWVAISFYLYHHGSPRIAASMAWVTAIPLLGYGLIVLLFIVLKPDMR